MATRTQSHQRRNLSFDSPNNPYESAPLEEVRSAGKASRSELSSLLQSSDFTPAGNNRPRSWTWHILSHIVSFSWVVPIIILLILNFKNFIIGPSAWCPRGHCASQIWDANDTAWGNDSAVASALQFDKADHNFLGVLQLLAKASEVWFVLLATALVYDLTMIIAKSEGGLPIALFLTHIEFADIRNLFNPSLWTSSRPIAGTSIYQKKNAVRLFFFSIIAAILTILTNLMGPASAVLILPTIQWIDTKPMYAKSYATLNSPQGDLDLHGCNGSMLRAGNFSCAYDRYGKVLDQRALETLLTTSQSHRNVTPDYLDFVIREAGMTFLMNLTEQSTDIVLAPNRQVISWLSDDLAEMANPDQNSTNNATALWLKRSLSLITKQTSPSVGFLGDCNIGNFSKTEIAEDKQIWCITDWFDDLEYGHSNYTKCFRIGTGFGATNNLTRFYIEDPTGKPEDISTVVDLAFSDKAVYFNSTTDFDSGIKDCLDLDDPSKCDWDKVFSISLPNSMCSTTDMCRLAANLTIVSYASTSNLTERTKNNLSDLDSDGKNSRFFCDHVSYLSFPTYTFEPSKSSNPTQVGKMLSGDPLIRDTSAVIIDIGWLLAAWSVSRNGTISADRQVAQGIANTLPSAFEDVEGYPDVRIMFFHYQTLFHALSMVGWSYFDPEPGNAACDAFSSTMMPDGRHCLYKWVSRRVWAFNISSRTSKMGVSVAIMGILVALWRLYLGIFHPNSEHSLLGLFVAALRHQSRGEFEIGELGEREKLLGKVRYRIVDDEGERPRFVPEQYRIGVDGLEEEWILYQRRLNA